MTPGQWAYIEQYIRDLADRMGLKDWEIIVSRVPSRDGVLATVRVTYGRRQARMWLSEDFAGGQPHEQRLALTHELIHCHMDRMDTVARQLEPVIGTAAHAVFMAAHAEAHEQATDALAVVLGAFLPPCEVPEVSA